MEPIEQDLEERKARQRKLAIELQRLEETRHRAGTRAHRERAGRIADYRRQLQALKFSIGELEEIIAEGRRQKAGGRERPAPPDTSRRRVLSDAERKRIGTRYRRELLAELRLRGATVDERKVRIHVERVTDLDGEPICTFDFEPDEP